MRRWIAAGTTALLLAAALGVLELGRIQPRDLTDEPEWTAISAVHFRQLFLGQPPPGAELDAARGLEPVSPWRSGVQATTFGWANPCLPKLVWGAALELGGLEEVPPEVFQRYHGGDQRVAERARERIRQAIPIARRLVWVASAGCAVLLFWIARALAGWLAGGIAFGLWLGAPLVRTWSHHVRPDLMMLLLLLATLGLAALAWESLSGRRGARAMILRAAGLGVLCGLCASAKFNGAVASLFAGAAIPLLWWQGRREHGLSLARSALPALLAAGLSCVAVFWLLNPILWSDPIGRLGEVLAFWRKHMAFQQGRWAEMGGAVAHDLGERLALLRDRFLGQEEPLRALVGAPGGALLLALGLAALAARALGVRILEAASSRGGARARRVRLWWLAPGVGTALWLPLDWDRYYLPLLAGAALLEGALVGLLLGRLQGLFAARSA